MLFERPVTLNNFIQTACLPGITYPKNNINDNVYAAGWGLLNSDDFYTPDLLHNVKLSILGDKNCAYEDFSDASMLCVGNG